MTAITIQVRCKLDRHCCFSVTLYLSSYQLLVLSTLSQVLDYLPTEKLLVELGSLKKQACAFTDTSHTIKCC